MLCTCVRRKSEWKTILKSISVSSVKIADILLRTLSIEIIQYMKPQKNINNERPFWFCIECSHEEQNILLTNLRSMLAIRNGEATCTSASWQDGQHFGLQFWKRGSAWWGGGIKHKTGYRSYKFSSLPSTDQAWLTVHEIWIPLQPS